MTNFAPPSIEALQRPGPSREPKLAILIATEDGASSRLYFGSFADHVKNHYTIFLPPHRGSAPKSVVDAANEFKDAKDPLGTPGGENRFDEIWVIFDTEGPGNAQRDKEAREAIERARQLGFKTGVSNPSFEYWIILHYEKFEGFLPNGKAALRKAEKLTQEHDNFKYQKNKDVFNLTRHRIDFAIQNAEKIIKIRYQNTSQHPCDCHPSTQLHLLAKRLLNKP
ncbi:MAG: RloB family protein [Isosphaeraceae bacterium]